MQHVTFGAVFVAGTLSFLSPCVFPLVPGYLSFITGTAAGEQHSRRRAMLAALAFTAGFGLVFVALGASASTIGQLMGAHRRWLELAGGVVVLVFGLHLLGVLRLSLLFREARFHSLPRPKGPGGAMLVGAAFGFGWSPCIGPLLGGVLTLAAAEGTVGQGTLLLATYALGMGLPFILAAILVERFLRVSKRVRPWLPWVERSAGVLLTTFAILLLTGELGVIAAFLPGLESLAL